MRRALLAASAAFAVVATAALAGTTYGDPVGDVGGSAGPDLASISVSNTQKAITFRFRFAKAPPLRVSQKEKWVDMLLVLVDVPPFGMRKLPSGYIGADYYLGTHGPSTTGSLVRAKTRTRVAIPARTVGATLTLTTTRRQLGDPARFRFVVAAGRETEDEDSDGRADFAPATGAFRYRLTG